MARRRGRPSKLTPEVSTRFFQALRAGNYYKACCSYAGISEQTFRNWMIRGTAELERVAESSRRSVRVREQPYAEFVRDVEVAEAEAEVRMVAQWQTHMPTTWQACRDFLARRFPERWAQQKLAVDVNARVSGQVQFTTHQITVRVPPPLPDEDEENGAGERASDDAVAQVIGRVGRRSGI